MFICMDLVGAELAKPGHDPVIRRNTLRYCALRALVGWLLSVSEAQLVARGGR